MGIFINTISILKKNFYPQDTYYSVDTVKILVFKFFNFLTFQISEVLSIYLLDGSNFNLFFNNALIEPIKQALKNEEIDVTQIKNSAGKLTPEDWVIKKKLT